MSDKLTRKWEVRFFGLQDYPIQKAAVMVVPRLHWSELEKKKFDRISDDEFYEVLLIMKKALQKAGIYGEKSIPIHEKELDAQLEEITQIISGNFEIEQARLWLFSPQKDLGGDCPYTEIRGGNFEKVKLFAEQIRDLNYQ